MRTLEDIEKEFAKVKAQREQAQQVAINCDKRLSELHGQAQILKEIEEEKKRTKKVAKEITDEKQKDETEK